MKKGKPEPKIDEKKLLEYAKTVIETEASAVKGLIPFLNSSFVRACKTLASCKGRIVTTGMGKAGIIAQKISATLASTGLPSLFLHPAEALHGDLGRVVEGDVVLMLSNSGMTEEILKLIQPVKRAGAVIISITSDKSSLLAQSSDISLSIGTVTEACPLGFAPSASTAAMLALGDALALAILNMRIERGDFSIEEYAQYHPAGAIGRRLLKVTDVMRKGDAAPVLPESATVEEAILSITKARAGAAVLVDEQGRLAGIFTDGDLRRYIRAGNRNISTDRISDFMTRNPKYVTSDALAAEALSILKKFSIGELPVVDSEMRPIGVVNLKDISGIEFS